MKHGALLLNFPIIKKQYSLTLILGTLYLSSINSAKDEVDKSNQKIKCLIKYFIVNKLSSSLVCLNPLT